MGPTHESPTHACPAQPAPAQPFGLLAGWGRYPLLIAEALKRQGRPLFCLGVLGQADPRLGEICDDFRFLGLAKFGSAIRYFKRRGVREIAMAGKVQKRFMFQPWFIVRHLPDLRTLRAFAPHFFSAHRDNKDDSLLATVVDLFASEGIRFTPPTDYAPELLVKEGQLTRRGPNAAQMEDVRFGWRLAKEMGRLDVGQTVVVKNRAVLAVEAVEGTDECIRRAAQLCPAGRFTVVKVAKPQQDMRFDVPTVGLKTLQGIVAGGGSVLAVEADRTIIVDREELIDFADRNRLVIVALKQAAQDASTDRAADAA
jgi:hypothetical protein